MSTNECTDYEYISDVEWGPRKDEDGYDTDQELACRPKKTPPNDSCGCFPPKSGFSCVNDGCVNFACREECRSNCESGMICGNKRIQKKQFADLEIFEAGAKGKGLRLTGDATVPKGGLLCEYTGRAVRESALSRLFRRYQFDRRLYILGLGNGVFIDARTKGGKARFINHSCRPNCKVEIWNVKGILRAAIFATRDIAPGTELTFDYKWERKRGRAPTVCHCGESNCRGTLEISLDDGHEGDWEETSIRDQTLVNRTLKIFNADSKSNFVGQVTGYDADKSLHKVLYRDLTEVWEDLNTTKFLILNEKVDERFYMIAKKTTSSSAKKEPQSLVTAARPEQRQKNFLFVSEFVKAQLHGLHFIDQCQRSCNVVITAKEYAKPPLPCNQDDPEDVEKYAAFSKYKTQLVYKLTIQGSDIAKAITILEKNVAAIERKAEEKPVAEISISATESTTAIFPRIIADIVKQRIKDSNVSYVFAPSESKSKDFSRIVIQGNSKTEIEASCLYLWELFQELCSSFNAPKTRNGMYKNLGFYGGELSQQDLDLLLGNAKTSQSMDASEDLADSAFIKSFESTYGCMVWIQSRDDQGRINSKNRIVEYEGVLRKIYFGCKPNQVPKLAATIQNRALELANGVRYMGLGGDRVYMKFMVQDKFFDFVKSITGASVMVDPNTGDFLRMDGRVIAAHNLPESVRLLSDSQRADLANEILRLQIECYRDECTRQQPWIFGRNWSLVSGTALDAFEQKKLEMCGFDIDIAVSKLELPNTVAAHTALIFYRFASVSPSCSSQAKLRDVVLACLFLANKAQKITKWKRLDAIMQKGYEAFFGGTKLDMESDEAATLQQRILAAEKEILEALQYDVFWQGVEWIAVPANGSGNMSTKKIDEAFAIAFSGPILSCGSELWLKYGVEYIFAVISSFLKADLSSLLPALNLIPLKVSQAAEVLVNSLKQGRTTGELHPLLKRGKGNIKDRFLPETMRVCLELMKSSSIAGHSVNTKASATQQRFALHGQVNHSRYAIKKVPLETVQSMVSRELPKVIAASGCRVYVKKTTSSVSRDLYIEGPWRSVWLADGILRGKVPNLAQLEDVSAEPQNFPKEQEKVRPGLAASKSVVSISGWRDTPIWSAFSDGGRLGGKCCVPGKIKESALRRAGLRWWIPTLQSPSGSLIEMIDLNPDADKVVALAEVVKGVALDSDEFPLLSKQVSHLDATSPAAPASCPVSVQMWPPEKVARKEVAAGTKAKHPTPTGFSAAALQELQLLRELHGTIPSPYGHQNFMIPVGVAVPQTSDSSTNEVKPSLQNVLASNAVFDDAKPRETFEDCPSLIFNPTPFVLNRFMSRKLRAAETDTAVVSPIILAAWFHDCLSALAHCHANSFLLRTLQAESIGVSSSGVLKFTSMYRTTAIPAEEKSKSIDPLKAAKKARKDKKRKKDDDETSSPYTAPEILLGCPKHSKESDVWAMGSLLAHLLLSKPLFVGKERALLLRSQYKIVGSPASENFPKGKEFPHFDRKAKKYKRAVEKGLCHLLKDQAELNQKAIDLLAKMLHLNPSKRCTAQEALGHEFITEYVENSRSEVFRQQYTDEWNKLKQLMMDRDQMDNAEKSRKRTAEIMKVSSTAADDLYDIDEMLAVSPTTKNKKVKLI